MKEKPYWMWCFLGELIRTVSGNTWVVKYFCWLARKATGNHWLSYNIYQESEDEERQLSLEGSLLDLRSYVEAILAQTNLQLGGIAQEVDTAQEKITKV